MSKKILSSFFVLVMTVSLFVPVIGIRAFDTTKVCGVDGQTYNNAEAAEAAGVDVSYEFACVNPSSEEGLYEATSNINFAGMLVEIGSTDIPTTIIVRRNNDQTDFTIKVTSDTVLGQRHDQATRLSDWIPGDQIRVIGKKNENTETITATVLVNLSFVIRSNRSANGWITTIDKEAKTITYQWMNKEHVFAYDDNTRFVAGLKNPATVDDLQIGDRIRARLFLRQGDISLAKIVVVLRRGPNLFMKIRTFRPNATLVRLDSTIIPTTIQVRIDHTPGLRANDVNNLIGAEGTLVTVNVTEDTKIVRKYFGHTTLDEFSIGDHLHIVGRVNDDGTVDAKLIKNNSIWKTSTYGYPGTVVEVNTDNNYIMVNWIPVKHLTRKRLKAKIQALNSAKESYVTAQIVSTMATIKDKTINKQILSKRLKNRIKEITAKKIGQFLRKVKHKKVKIDRIKHIGLKVGDLIERLPAKKIRVDITDNTEIIVGTNSNATINDIQVGDKVRIRGTKHADLPIVVADTIVVVASLPEVEENLDTPLDDINEIVSDIITNNISNAIVSDSTTDTEEEIISNEENNKESDEEVNNKSDEKNSGIDSDTSGENNEE